MGLQLLFILAGQGHVKEVLVFAQLAKGDADVALEVVPAQAELLGPHGGVRLA